MITCTFEDGNQNNLRHVTVGCIVVKDGQIMLGKRSQRLSEGGKWCIPGGYANRDETTVETGVRETLEETGWSVANLRLFRINDNPDRPAEDKQNIDFFYLADGIEKVGKTDWESQEVRWFDMSELPTADEIAFDHSETIDLYKKFMHDNFQLPIIGRL